MSMTPRENFLNFFRGEPYEWAPTSADILEFAPAHISDHVARGAVFQQAVFPETLYGGKDMFGVEWVYDPAARGSMEKAPLLSDPEELVNWRETVHFPDYERLIDWEACARENARFLDTDKVISTTLYTGLFERLISFVGFEDAAVAFLDEETAEELPALFDALVDSYLEYIRLLRSRLRVEHIVFHDDWGSQNSTLFSVGVFREFIQPALTTLADGAHRLGVVVEQHSCGKIEEFIPCLAETGIDTWKGQPINNKDHLINELGDRFRFCVVIAPPFYGDDRLDETIALYRAAQEKYRGKSVWFGLPYSLSEDGKNAFRERVLGK